MVAWYTFTARRSAPTVTYYNDGVNLDPGWQFVYGTAVNTNVGLEGVEIVESGGSTTGTTLTVFGEQFVSSGGSAINTTVSSYGSQDIQSGGTASGTTLAGGFEGTNSGGTAIGTKISSGRRPRTSSRHGHRRQGQQWWSPGSMGFGGQHHCQQRR